mgnify:CR=1 FL=1
MVVTCSLAFRRAVIEMKMNFKKCGFRVSVDKFLRFIINEKDIEATFEKVKGILDM